MEKTNIKIELPKAKPEEYFDHNGKPNIYVYCRVSKNTQDINKQFEEVSKYCKLHNIIPKLQNVLFDDGVSGGKDWREREIRKLTHLKKNDILIVPELTRIGRNGKNTIHYLDLILPQGAIVRDIKNDLIIDEEADINTTLKYFFICIFAEMEREMIKKRTQTAMNSEKVRAKIPNKLDKHRAEIEQYKKDGLNANQITDKLKEQGLNINKAQVYNYFNKIK